MKKVIGSLMVLAGVILGLWIGVWILFIGGFLQIVTSIRAEEFQTTVAAYGVLKMLLASLIGTICALVLIVPGVALLQIKRDGK